MEAADPFPVIQVQLNSKASLTDKVWRTEGLIDGYIRGNGIFYALKCPVIKYYPRFSFSGEESFIGDCKVVARRIASGE